jgi:signal transduction histidine kinase
LFFGALGLGELSGLLTLEILPGSFIYFKPVAYLVVAARLGPLPALALAAILGADIGRDIGNSYGLVAFALEALFAGWVKSRRPRLGLVAIVGVYWPLVGLPALGLIFGLGLGVSREALTLTLLKVWLNALFDAALAGMLADSPLVDLLLGSKPRSTRSMGAYLKDGVSFLVIPIAFLCMLVSVRSFRDYTDEDIGSRIRAGISRATSYLGAHGHGYDPEATLSAINRELSVREVDFAGHYELASSGPPAYRIERWGKGLFVRAPRESPHPIDRWRLSEYFGEVPASGPGLRYVVSFNFAFRGLYRFYASALGICLAFLYGFYALMLLVARALAARFASLESSAERLPERIEAGEELVWPELDIDELANLSDRFQEVSSRLRSLFSGLRSSRERLEATVKERTAELERRTEEVRLLLSRVEIEREEERSRVARELHDELGQDIASLGMALYILERRIVDPDGRIAEKLADMRELLAGLADNMKRLVADLRPSMLDRLGLPEALDSLAKERAERSGLRIEFQCDVPEYFSPPERLKIALYRIAQEALSNAIRHSASPWIALRLAADEAATVLDVRDGGKGFDARALSEGPRTFFGLIGMRERCRSLAGELAVSSVPGSGTLVSARFPRGGLG